MAAGFPLQTGLAANCFNIQLLQRIGPSKKLHGWLGLPLPSQSFICKYIYIYIYICIYMYISICPPTPLSIYPSFSSPTHQYLPIHPFFFNACLSYFSHHSQVSFNCTQPLYPIFSQQIRHGKLPPWPWPPPGHRLLRGSRSAPSSRRGRVEPAMGISGVGEHTSNFTAVYGRFI